MSLFNMPENARVCLNKQDSEYAWGLKFVKFLNMVKFWVRQDSQYASLTQCSGLPEYALTESWIDLGF